MYLLNVPSMETVGRASWRMAVDRVGTLLHAATALFLAALFAAWCGYPDLAAGTLASAKVLLVTFAMALAGIVLFKLLPRRSQALRFVRQPTTKALSS